MNDRLNQFLAAEQLNPARFADILGVQRSGVSHILSGRNKPGYDFLEKFITRFPSVNIEWLITGRGKMYKEVHVASLFPTVEELPVADPDLFSATTAQPVTSNEGIGKSAVVDESKLYENADGKTVERVIVFYTDKTFTAYFPA